MRRPVELRSTERKHFYAGQLTDAQLGRPITLAGNSWPVRGTLTAVSLDECTGLVEISTRSPGGRTSTTRVPPDTGVIVHRADPAHDNDERSHP